jgi:hypothetical protein
LWLIFYVTWETDETRLSVHGDQWFTVYNPFFSPYYSGKNLSIIIINENPVSLPCIPVWQIYNIPQIKFRIIPEELVKGD